MASLLGFLSKTYDQLNPFDNNRTFKRRTPTQNKSNLQQLGQIGGQTARAVGGNTVRLVNTGNLAARQVADTAKMYTAQFTHNPQAFRNANAASQRDYNRFSSRGGILNTGTVFRSPQEAQSGVFGTVARRVGGGTLGAASEILPVARGATLLKAGGRLLPNMARGALEGAGYGALGGTAGELVQGKGFNVRNVAKSAAIGGALGGATPLAGVAARGAGRLAKTSGKALNDAALPKQYRLGVEDRRVLSDYTDYLAGNSGYNPTPAAINDLTAQAMNIGKKAGIDVTSGSPRERYLRIGDFLQNFEARKQSVQQGGYIKLPEGADVPKPPKASARTVENKLTTGGKAGRQNISPEVQAGISGEHAVRSTQKLQEMAVRNANKQSLNKTIQQAHEALAVAPGKIDDQTVALAQQAIERADKAGRLQDAIAIHDSLSEHLVKQGQTIQAASLLYKLSPRGLFYKGLRDLKKSGKNITPELEDTLRRQADAISNATDQAAKQRATAAFHKTVADNIPKTAANNLLSVWKAGLLSGVKTQVGNFTSNATFAGLKAVSSPVSSLVDRALSLATGQRTKTATLRGLTSGGSEGVRTGIDTLKTGIDARNITGGKYEIHGELNFKNPVIQKVFGDTSNLVFRGMNAADQPFYYAALKNNLVDVAKAEGISKGLSGKELAAFVTKIVDNPTPKMAETAKLAAQRAVLGQDNKFASAVSTFAQSHPALQVLVPFAKVPTNFLSRTLDYTPVGAIKSVATNLNSLRKGQGIDQRALSEAIGEATTGSALIYLGAELANHKLLSGQYPSNDPKEAARWKAEGIQPNSIKLGNTWVSMNYLGPVGILFGAGKDFHDAASKGDNGTVAAIAGAGKSLTGQSFLTGFSGFANAHNYPQRNAATFLNSQAGSVVPSWLSDIANLGDTKQRETNSPLDAMKSRTPGLRNTLPVKLDTYGNQLKQRTDPLNLLANPLRPSNARSNSVIAEVSRLHSVDPNNSDLQVTPLPVKKVVKVEGKDVKLTDPQRHNLQQKAGQYLQKEWGKLIETPEYKKLSDLDKAAALNGLRTAASTLATRQFVLDNNLGSYNEQPSKAVIGLADNNDVLSFIKKPEATTNSNKKSATGRSRKNGTRHTKTARKAVSRRRGSRAIAFSSFKTASSIKAPGLPKITPKKPTTFKGVTTRKLAVSKLPSNYLNKKLARSTA